MSDIEAGLAHMNDTLGSPPASSADSTPPTNDTWTVRIVVLVLGCFALGVLVAETILQMQDRTLPDNVQTLGGVAVGALGAMLASTASRRN